MPHSTKKSLRILVVDDEPAVRRAYQLMLKHLGHRVQIADDGKTALALLESESFDLIITDYLMPDMKGDELIAEVRGRNPNQRMIMVSAFGESIRAAGSMAGSADCIVSKPFGIQELQVAIAKVTE